MAGITGIDTFVKVVAFQSNTCDQKWMDIDNLLMFKRYLYLPIGVILRQCDVTTAMRCLRNDARRDAEMRWNVRSP